MRHLVLLLLALNLIGCNKRTVQLPETLNKDITEILDVSPAYIFYDEETDSAEFNRKNLISTTNWLVNVDKRLTLKQAIPHIIFLQEKRKKASMHKNEKARNYFSCSNPEINNLAFIDFTGIEYKTNRLPGYNVDTQAIKIRLLSSENIEISNPQRPMIKADMVTLLDSIKTVLVPRNVSRIGLQFNENISFQDYIDCKSKLLHLDSSSVEVLKTEFILN